MNNFYKFTVRWQNEDYQPELLEGVVSAADFADATKQLSKDFDNIESLQIEPIGDYGNILLFEEILAFLNNKYEDVVDTVGPKLREALEDAIEVEKEQKNIFYEIKEGLREAIEYERLKNNSKAQNRII